MQAKDIPDEEILVAIGRAKYPSLGANRWELAEMLPQYPPKVIRAKCWSMMQRGIIDGCDCGCRGDWIIVTK